MQGHFDLQMLHTPGLTQELMDAVRREGGDPAVEEHLRRFQKDGEWHTDNLILQTFPSYLYWQVMSATSKYGYDTGGLPSGLGFIQLATTATEPSYSGDIYSGTLGWASLPDTPTGIVSASACKIFVNNCIVSPDIKSDANGREAIYGKFKWLYLPGECTSDQIRSITIWGAGAQDNLNDWNKTRTGRVRIKDSGGNPVTMNKLATKSLFVEYTFTMVSL